MGENNEIEVNVIDVTAVNESEVMSGLEVHSTPNVVQNSKLNESDTIDDSGIQVTPISINKNNKSENDMMKYLWSTLCSTNNKFDRLSSDVNEVNVQLNEQNKRFYATDDFLRKMSTDVNEMKEQNVKLENKVSELKGDTNVKLDEQNVKFNEIKGEVNAKFDELKGEMKQQNININEVNGKVTESQKNIDDKLNEMNTKLIQQLDKLGRNIKNNEGIDLSLIHI